MAQLLIGGGDRPLRQVTFEWGEPIECDLTREELEERTRPLAPIGASLLREPVDNLRAEITRSLLRKARREWSS